MTEDTRIEAVARAIAPLIMWEFDGWRLDEAVNWEVVGPKDQAKLYEIARAAIAAMPVDPRIEQAREALRDMIELAGLLAHGVPINSYGAERLKKARTVYQAMEGGE